MKLKQDIKTRTVNKYKSILQSKVYFRVFGDNSGALKISRINKYGPRNKHLNNRLHHLRSYVDTSEEITMQPISTKYQSADILTKALNVKLLTKF